MKKTLHFAFAFATIFFFAEATAQNTGSVQETTNSEFYGTKYQKPERSTIKAGGINLFYEDFANGLSGNNIAGAWTTGGQDGALWELDFDGSQGQFWGMREPLMSTTESNGWMMFDGDGSNPGIPADFENREGYLVSPVIDLTGFPNVHMELEQYFRFCCSFLFRLNVSVTTDGFQTMTTFNLSDPYARNEDSANPYMKRLSITSALVGGDLSNVQFRFEWEGLDVDPNNQGTSHYFWMIDDVALLESPNNDVVLTDAAHSDFSTTGELEYSIYPYSQLSPITFKSWVLNDGVNAQTNIVLNIDVAGNTPFSGTSTSIGLGALEVDSLLGTTTFTPPATADTYTINYSLTQDAVDDNPDNNDTTGTFAVEEFIFARDMRAADGSTDNQGEAYELCNIFDIVNDVELYSIDVAIRVASTVGTLMDGTIVDANLDPYDETFIEYTVDSVDLNSNGDAIFKHLILDVPVTLFAGESYGVCLRHFGGADTLRVATSGTSPEQTSFIYDTPTATWFFTTNTPMVRMNFDPDVAIGIGMEENDLGITTLNAFPNPANDNPVISFSIEEPTELSIEVRDVNGKVVFVKNLGRISAGEQRVELNTRNYPNGVYFYSLTNVNGRISKRLVVIK